MGFLGRVVYGPKCPIFIYFDFGKSMCSTCFVYTEGKPRTLNPTKPETLETRPYSPRHKPIKEDLVYSTSKTQCQD